ncbi:DUF421 domain-containing protein [Qipengyuania psychrotolerans]|uniref:DUF421 domain-containing protein n=1 Tax=Qipengyuania psychrotolerans TaxID=2867238 RepID=A0ABX8ZG96_9SPHN|nr:YetF domain-containing protein [Qipengyuania psychrotolerans]QZD86624.1 DUF421 domain-containing protein [Qipengyuania psychrotolerans]
MFFDEKWLDIIARGSILTALALVWIVLMIRIVGLRSLSKMTNFDFVMTVALGSLLAGASQVTKWGDFAQIGVGIVALFAMQVAAALLRRSSDKVEAAIQNTPVYLMRDGVIDEDALSKTRVARSDLIAKLREANVLHFDEVRAVVLEATGDVSVLHGDSLDERLTQDVEKA